MIEKIPDMISRFPCKPEAPKSSCTDCKRSVGCVSPCLDVGGTPGLPVLVLEAPTAWEDDHGSALVCAEGMLLKTLLKGLGYAPGTYNVVYAVGCNGDLPSELEMVECRKYLRHKLEKLNPSKILSFGGNVGFALTGFGYDDKSVRKGIRWLDIHGQPIPVHLLMSERDVVANSTLVNPMKEDLRYAMSSRPSHQNYEYYSVDDAFDSDLAKKACIPSEFVAFDIESSGVQHDANYRVTCISFWPVYVSVVDGRKVYNVGKLGYTYNLDTLKPYSDWPNVLSDIKEILTSCNLVGWNSKYDAIGCVVDSAINVLPNVVSDTRIKRKLLEADADGKLATAADLVGFGGHKQEAQDVLAKIVEDLQAIKSYNKPSVRKRRLPTLNTININSVPPYMLQALMADADPKTFAYGFLPRDICDRYNALDTLTTALLEVLVRSRLDQDKQTVWDEVCAPAMHALTSMELYGIQVDTAALQSATTHIAAKLSNVEATIRAKVGDPNFNSGSPIQVRNLMTKLGLKVKKKTNSGLTSTAEMALEPFKHVPVIADILEYRRLKKLLGTYCEGLSSCVVNGRIHASFLQGGTETGRVSCFDPNLQNIPTATSSYEAKLIRDSFVAGPGRCFVEADYGQLEIRIAAWLSEDPKMIEVLSSGVDFHQRTAEMICWVWGVGPDGIDEEKRKEAKCFHPDTEVLTKSGWKKITDLEPLEEVIQATPSNNGEVELSWVVPNEVFTQKHPSGELVKLHNESIDLEVTPDHRMLGWNHGHKHYVTTPAEFNKVHYWASAGMLSDGTYADCDLIRLAVAAQADGSITPSGLLRFGFTKERKIQRLGYLLEKAGIKYNKTLCNSGITTFRIPAKDANQITELLDNKQFHWGWLGFGPEQRLAAIEELRFWDGNTPKNGTGYNYTQLNKQSTEVMQALCSITNHKASLRFDGKYSKLSVKTRNYSMGRNIATTTLPFHDDVACLSVPSSFVLVRFNGKVTVTGQTANFAVLYELPDRLGMMLANRLKCDRREGQKIADAIFGAFGRLRKWMDEQLAIGTKLGGTHTVWNGDRETEAKLVGRFRPLWKLGTSIPEELGIKDSHKRSTWNGAVQGTAGDLATGSLLLIQMALDSECPGAKIVVTIHDSITVECEESQAEQVAKILKRIMTRYKLLTSLKDDQDNTVEVPLVVDFKKGTSWGSMQKYKPALN